MIKTVLLFILFLALAGCTKNPFGDTILSGEDQSPATISFAIQPSGMVAAGATFSPSPIVEVKNTAGLAVPGALVTLTPYTTADCSSTLGAGIVSNNTITTNSIGLSTFTSLSYNRGETIYLKATVGTISTCSTGSVIVAPPAPTTVSFSPAAQSIATVPLSITLTFSSPIIASTIIPSNLSMSCSGAGAFSIISSIPSGDGLSATVGLVQTIAPTNAELCTLFISGSVLDLFSNALSGTTSVAYTINNVNPTVAFSPSTSVVSSVPSSITAQFDKAMVVGSGTNGVENISNWNMSCVGMGVFSISSISYNAGTYLATINLSQSVAPVEGDICTLNPQNTQLLDTNGNQLVSNSTSLTIVPLGPSVLSFSPADSTTNTLPLTSVITFSKSMKFASLSNVAHWSIGCTGGGAFTISSVTPSTTTFANDTATVQLTQTTAVSNGSVCTLTPLTSLLDTYDVALTGSSSVAYTIDTIAPTVVFDPVTSTKNAVPSSFSAIFSESLETSSATNVANWTMACSGAGAYTVSSAVVSTTSLTNDTVTISLSQVTPAVHGEICTLTAATTIQDQSGNALAGSRTSAITIDSTNPTISAFSPAASTRTTVPTSVAVTFSKNMNQSLVENNANWNVSCTIGGTYTISSVSLSGMVATVNISETTVAANTAVCTLTASTAMQDTIGNSLAGTLTVSYTISRTMTVLVVAGGGGGGRGRGGGGGAGGLISNTSYPVNVGSTYTITVGAGGAGGTILNTTAPNGGNSIFDTLTAVGGGGGAGTQAFVGSQLAGAAGGSGGGGSGNGVSPGYGGSGGSATSGQGFGGGKSYSDNSGYTAGGGGGGSSVAGANSNLNNSGKGGDGTTNSITGTAVVYAGGGGGGGDGSAIAGSGGTGGGGVGSSTSTGGNATGYGSGGGGGTSNQNGGSGSSGIVIISYDSSLFGTCTATGAYSTTTSGGNKIFRFTGNGTFTVQ